MTPKTNVIMLMSLAVALQIPAPAASAPQARRGGGVPDPPYMSQFPSVDRVKNEIKGSDPMDTAARQMGAFWQLQQIIQDLAGPRAFRNELSARENEWIGAYRGGYQSAGQ